MTLRLDDEERPPTRLRKSCGTTSGWTLHIRYFEASCRPCRDAHAVDMAARRISTRRRPSRPGFLAGQGTIRRGGEAA